MNLSSLSYNGLHYTECSREFLEQSGVPALVIDEAFAAQELEAIQAARRSAMASEANPLYLDWQYSQDSKDETAWRAKVAEIKARYPLPGE